MVPTVSDFILLPFCYLDSAFYIPLTYLAMHLLLWTSPAPITIHSHLYVLTPAVSFTLSTCAIYSASALAALPVPPPALPADLRLCSGSACRYLPMVFFHLPLCGVCLLPPPRNSWATAPTGCHTFCGGLPLAPLPACRVAADRLPPIYLYTTTPFLGLPP